MNRGNSIKGEGKGAREGYSAVVLLHAISEGGSGGLVDDALDLEARDLTSVLGRLALGVVEVGGDGDHSRRDLQDLIKTFDRILGTMTGGKRSNVVRLYHVK